MDRERGGTVRIVCAMLIFGSIGIFRRYIPLSSAVLAAVRGGMGALFLLAVMLLRKKKLTGGINGRTFLMLCAAGAVMGFNWILLFEAYNYTTVATATLCYYMEPTFVILASPIFLGEKLTPGKLVCTLTALVGMVLVSGVAENGLPSLEEARGVLLGLGAAVLYSAVVILNKKTSQVETYTKTVIELAAAGICLVPYILLTGSGATGESDALAIVMLLIVGLVHTGVAYALYFGSISMLRAQKAALLSYIDPVSALLLSWAILGERLSLFGIIGAVLILGSAVVQSLGGDK